MFNFFWLSFIVVNKLSVPSIPFHFQCFNGRNSAVETQQWGGVIVAVMGGSEIQFSGNLRFCAKYPRDAATHFAHKAMISQWTTTAPRWTTDQHLYIIAVQNRPLCVSIS